MRPDFLFATPSFLSGVARTLDLGAQFDSYNESLTQQAADANAIRCDWRIVGENLFDAMRQWREPSIPPRTKKRAATKPASD